MGGFFGITSKNDCMMDAFFGTDYHSHLGTYAAGMAAYSPKVGLQREIHSIKNAPFRTKFWNIFDTMEGTSAIGCISDTDPQPLLIRSKLGTYAICFIGIINNSAEIIGDILEQSNDHFDAMTGGKVNTNELVAAIINQKGSFEEGIKHAQEIIDGTVSILILKDDGSLIAARDKRGRLPIIIGKREDGYAVSFESFVGLKLGYEDECELGPGEIVELTPDSMTRLAEPTDDLHICAFLWSYYGYPTSAYEGVNVEMMRYRNGAIMYDNDAEKYGDQGLDYVGGVPDSGTPHAIGYANQSGIPFARAFIKYTPTWSRSFMPGQQNDRDQIAQMKQIPIRELIKDKNLLFVDDSIVRGTQLENTVNFLYENGAKSVHMRSACPPLMFMCKYLGFSRANSDMELITRRTIFELEGEEGAKHIDEYLDGNSERGKAMRQAICDKLGFSSLDFQSLDGIVKAIGLPKCKLCTYCWDGTE